MVHSLLAFMSSLRESFSLRQKVLLAPSLDLRSQCDRVSQLLIVARQRTLKEGDALLSGLAEMRNFWKEQGAIEMTLETPDGCHVNGLHFPGSMNKAIIFLHGNGCFYETSSSRPCEWQKDLTEIDADGSRVSPHVIVFNPRGTGKSDGVTHPDAVATDLLTLFEYLISQGVDPNHVVIAGHSMGAYLLAPGVALLQEKYPDSSIHFLSDRSFADIHSRIDRTYEPGKCEETAEAIHTMVASTKWDKDVLAALDSLKGRVCIIYHEGDPVVPYETSVHHRLLQSTRHRKFTCIALNDPASVHNSHTRELKDDEYRQFLTEMKIMLGLPLELEEQNQTDAISALPRQKI